MLHEFLIHLITVEDRWKNAESKNHDTPFLLRFRPHLQKFITTKNYNQRLGIVWHYNSNGRSFMPTEYVLKQMQNFEDALIDILEQDAQSVLAIVYTGQNKREWQWYSIDVDEAYKRLNLVLPDFEKLSIEVSAEIDPEWQEYSAVLNEVDDEDS